MLWQHYCEFFYLLDSELYEPVTAFLARHPLQKEINYTEAEIAILESGPHPDFSAYGSQVNELTLAKGRLQKARRKLFKELETFIESLENPPFKKLANEQ